MKRVAVIFCLLAGVLCILFLFLPKKTQLQDVKVTEEEQSAHAEVQTSNQRPTISRRVPAGTKDDDPTIEDRLKELAEDRPIDFYGQVVDQFGVPIAGANIHFIWTKFWPQESVEARTVSDSGGNFSLINKMGRRMVVHVTKNGYYTSRKSNNSFEYGDASDKRFHEPSTNSPVIFQLHKKGEAEPLVTLKKAFRIPRDGTPVEIDLFNGKIASTGQGHVKVECWTNDGQKGAYNRYDWRCRISIPNGGLLRTDEEFIFEAPEDDYQSFDEINMPASLGQDWETDARRNYFLKLPSDVYGRLFFKIIPGGDHFFRIESYLNPSGSRNLEYDPDLTPAIGQIKSRVLPLV